MRDWWCEFLALNFAWSSVNIVCLLCQDIHTYKGLDIFSSTTLFACARKAWIYLVQHSLHVRCAKIYTRGWIYLARPYICYFLRPPPGHRTHGISIQHIHQHHIIDHTTWFISTYITSFVIGNHKKLESLVIHMHSFVTYSVPNHRAY